MKQLLTYSQNAARTVYAFFRKRPVLLLVVLAIISHIQWFNPTSTLFYSDWRNRDSTVAHDTLNFSRASWITQEDLGQQNVQLYGYIPTLLWGLAGSYDLGVKIGFLWPIAFLSLLAPYFLLKKITRREDVAIISALFYGFSSYLIVLTTNHLPIAVVYSLAPFIILSYMRLMELPNYVHSFLFATLFTIGCLYELRIMFIVTIILAWCTLLYWQILKSKWLYISIAIVIVLNLFWILPTALGGAGGQIDSIANRGLFGDNLFTFKDAVAFFAWRWTGSTPEASFVPQPVLSYFWLLPVMALVTVVSFPKLDKKSQKLVLFFGGIVLFGIAFGKQSSAPFPQLFHWFYSNVPGFNLFREASKFYLAIGVGYVGLLAVGLKYVAERSAYRAYKQYIFAFALIPILFLMWPLVSGRMGTLYVNRHKPTAYQVFTDKVLHDSESYRTLWMPRTTGWGVYNDKHPRIDAATVAEGAWKDVVSPLTTENSLSPTMDMIESSIGQTVLNSASVKYVVVPIRDTANDDDFYRAYGDDPQYFIDRLAAIPWLKRVDLGPNDLVAFENTTYQQRIFAFSQLANFTDADNIGKTYAFANDTLGLHNTNFVINNDEPGSRAVRDVFNGLTPANVQTNKIAMSTQISKPSTLFGNAEKREITYTITGNILRLFAVKQGSVFAQNTNGSTQNQTTLLQSIAVNPVYDYYASIDDQTTPIIQASGQRYLGAATKSARIVGVEKNSIVPNGSFEAGLWHKTAEDCNAYNDKPNISMDTDTSQHTDGKLSLSLGSLNHTACTTSAAIAVTPATTYELTYDVRLRNTHDFSYQIINTATNTVLTTVRKSSGSSQWQTMRQQVAIPKGVSSIKIRLLGLPNQKRSNAYGFTNYDNVRLTKIVSSQYFVMPQPTYATTSIAPGGNTISYSQPNQQAQNLIKNPSFEQGMWQQKVGDCNAYNDSPKLSMKLVDTASNGAKALELGAKSHVACTSTPTIPVHENGRYLLSFDYQSPNSARAGYYISFNDKNSTSFTERMDAEKDWQKFSKVVKVPAGATSLRLSIYAYADQYEAAYLKTRYDNFYVSQIPSTIQGNYFLASDVGTTLATPQKVAYTDSNPTRKEVTITGARKPFYLAMNDAYHAGWRISMSGGNAAAINRQHFKLNNYANGWYVDPLKVCAGNTACQKHADGSYAMKLAIVFTPQSYFYKGLGISTAGFIILGTAAAVLFKRKPLAIRNHRR